MINQMEIVNKINRNHSGLDGGIFSIRIVIIYFAVNRREKKTPQKAYNSIIFGETNKCCKHSQITENKNKRFYC